MGPKFLSAWAIMICLLLRTSWRIRAWNLVRLDFPRFGQKFCCMAPSKFPSCWVILKEGWSDIHLLVTLSFLMGSSSSEVLSASTSRLPLVKNTSPAPSRLSFWTLGASEWVDEDGSIAWFLVGRCAVSHPPLSRHQKSSHELIMCLRFTNTKLVLGPEICVSQTHITYMCLWLRLKVSWYHMRVEVKSLAPLPPALSLPSEWVSATKNC